MSEYNVTRNEKLLSSVASGNPSGIDPITREEMFLSYIAGESETKPKPITRKEKLLDKIGASGNGGGAKPEQEKTVNITENGTTEIVPDEGNTLSKVTVNTIVVDSEIGKPYIDTSKMINFTSFIEWNPGLLDELEKIDTSNATSLERMFFGNYDIEICPSFDTSNCISFENMFYGCKNLTLVPLFDTSKGRVFSGMFRGCEKLKNIPLLDISSAISISWTFAGCTALETISFTTTTTDLAVNTFNNCTALQNITIGEGWAVNIYLHYSNNLTAESLHGMIENLADLTGQTAKTFQVGETNLAKIDEDHMAMLNAKNWNYS